MLKALIFGVAYLGLAFSLVWYLIEYHDHDDHWMA